MAGGHGDEKPACVTVHNLTQYQVNTKSIPRCRRAFTETDTFLVLQAQQRLDADRDVEQVMVFGRSLTAKKVRGSHRAVDTSGKVGDYVPQNASLGERSVRALLV